MISTVGIFNKRHYHDVGSFKCSDENCPEAIKSAYHSKKIPKIIQKIPWMSPEFEITILRMFFVDNFWNLNIFHNKHRFYNDQCKIFLFLKNTFKKGLYVLPFINSIEILKCLDASAVLTFCITYLQFFGTYYDMYLIIIWKMSSLVFLDNPWTREN